MSAMDPRVPRHRVEPLGCPVSAVPFNVRVAAARVLADVRKDLGHDNTGPDTEHLAERRVEPHRLFVVEVERGTDARRWRRRREAGDVLISDRDEVIIVFDREPVHRVMQIIGDTSQPHAPPPFADAVRRASVALFCRASHSSSQTECSSSVTRQSVQYGGPSGS